MYTGTQQTIRKDTDYKTFKQLGVNHICGQPEIPHQQWTANNLSLYREKVESFGLILDMIELPLSSGIIDERAKKGGFVHILTGSPEREKEIDRTCKIIKAVSESGIQAVKYNLNIIGMPRTESEYGRGGAKLSTFKWDKAKNTSPKLTIAGQVNKNEFWERIDYFLEKVVPVAEESKVRLACHPHRLYSDISFHLKNKNKLILPAKFLNKEILKNLKNKKKHLINYGIVIKKVIKSPYKVFRNYCHIEKPFVILYLFSLLEKFKVKSIIFVGFKGFTKDNPFQENTQEYLNFFKKNNPNVRMRILGPTSYKI